MNSGQIRFYFMLTWTIRLRTTTVHFWITVNDSLRQHESGHFLTYDQKIIFFPIAEGGTKIFGVFRVKNHDFTPKNQIPNSGQFSYPLPNIVSFLFRRVPV
jgi:hypothetical protein